MTITTDDRLKLTTAGKPTLKTSTEWQIAFDFFNNVLFNGELPECMITLNNKGPRYLGYFTKDKFLSTNGETKDCISINPIHLLNYTLMECFATLVHEMCHLWEAHQPDGGKTMSYHSVAWGSKMESIGLMPSNTGKPGGKRRGQQMHHYVIEGGQFEEVCIAFINAQYGITWAEHTDNAVNKTVKKKPKSKYKYTCPVCGDKVWGKPGLRLICVQCSALFEMEGAEEMPNDIDDLAELAS